MDYFPNMDFLFDSLLSEKNEENVQTENIKENSNAQNTFPTEMPNLDVWLDSLVSDKNKTEQTNV